jgi:4-hydroxy-tetrahydrodipicolinate reductase
MGRAVVRLATERGDRVVCAIATGDVGRDAGELAGIGAIGVTVTSDFSQLGGSSAMVAIDFSGPSGVVPLASAAARARIAVVSGTTGLDPEATAALAKTSQEVAVLWEPNMSVGIAVLADLVREAVARLGLGFDVEIVEAHHRLKTDAPSGTALRLAEVAQSARDDGADLSHGRHGQATRPNAQVGMHAIRGGDVIGDHTVHLLGAGERLELTHRATSRELFAHGALRAASWIAGKPAGRYSLSDVLASA